MEIPLLLSIRICFPSLISWLMYKLDADFGLPLLKEVFPMGKMPSPPQLSTTTRTAVEVSYGSCSAEHVAHDLPSLPPFPQHYINTRSIHVSVHLFWMYIAFCFNLERKGKTFYATNQSTHYHMTSLLILYLLQLQYPVAGTAESPEKVQLLVSSN